MEWELLNTFSPDDRRSVLQVATGRRCAKGEVAFREGEAETPCT